MDIEWRSYSTAAEVFGGRDRTTGELKWSGSYAVLVFGLNSQFRAIAKVYACDDAQQAFVGDFVTPWSKVMNLESF